MGGRRTLQHALLAVALLAVGLGAVAALASLPVRSPTGAVAATPTGIESPAGPVSTPTPDPSTAATPTTAPPSPATCVPPPAGAPAARVVSHGSRKDKVIALTFDDGYDADNTAKILAIVQAEHVNVTFFPVGRAVELEPAVWRDVARAGFPIGDHTYAHHRLKGACFDVQLSDLERQVDVVQGVLGERPVLLMRPPYGAYDRNTRIAASAAGDADVVLWDVDTKDWTGVSVRTIVARATAGTNGSIVLMHTFPHNTALALPKIIDSYRKRGFRFVTVGELLGIRGPVPFP